MKNLRCAAAASARASCGDRNGDWPDRAAATVSAGSRHLQHKRVQRNITISRAASGAHGGQLTEAMRQTREAFRMMHPVEVGQGIGLMQSVHNRGDASCALKSLRSDQVRRFQRAVSLLHPLLLLAVHLQSVHTSQE
jgi:hypothetical protein